MKPNSSNAFKEPITSKSSKRGPPVTPCSVISRRMKSHRSDIHAFTAKAISRLNYGLAHLSASPETEPTHRFPSSKFSRTKNSENTDMNLSPSKSSFIEYKPFAGSKRKWQPSTNDSYNDFMEVDCCETTVTRGRHHSSTDHRYIATSAIGSDNSCDTSASSNNDLRSLDDGHEADVEETTDSSESPITLDTVTQRSIHFLKHRRRRRRQRHQTTTDSSLTGDSSDGLPSLIGKISRLSPNLVGTGDSGSTDAQPDTFEPSSMKLQASKNRCKPCGCSLGHRSTKCRRHRRADPNYTNKSWFRSRLSSSPSSSDSLMEDSILPIGGKSQIVYEDLASDEHSDDVDAIDRISSTISTSTEPIKLCSFRSSVLSKVAEK